MKEEWVDIDGLEGSHQVSSFGRVRSLDRLNSRGQRIAGKVFCAQPRPQDGHVTANISKDARPTRQFIHRLVAKAFISNPDGLPEVGHVDGNRSNNVAENLYWTDHGDFLETAYYSGARSVAGAAGKRGEASPCAKINEETVIAMRGFSGTHQAAADYFGVSHSLASKVRRGSLWGHVVTVGAK